MCKNNKNKLVKYKKISLIFMINFNCIAFYMLYILYIYKQIIYINFFLSILLKMIVFDCFKIIYTSKI